MANAYWIEHVNKDGFALMQTLIARTESGARQGFAEYSYFTADDPKGTVEVRLTRNGTVIDSIKRNA